MKTLNEELEAVKDDNTIIGAKPPKVRTLFDVVKTGNYSLEDFKKSKELVAPEFESDINVRVREGISRGVQDIKNVPQGVEIFGGQVEMRIGGWAGSEETVERGRNLIKTAIDELDAKEKSYYQSAIPMSSKDYESLSFGLGQGITNYGAMLATGYLGGAVAGIGSMAVLEGTQKAQEKIGYYTEKTGDKELKGYTPEQAGKDVALTAIYTAGSAIMEKKLGYGAQRKLFKMPVGEKVKNVVLTGLSESGTETLQELYATGIDFVGGYIDSSKLPERFLGAVQEGVIGGILGGTAGIAAAVNHRSQAKQILRENLQNTVPQKDLENVVNAVYESTSDSMANIITQELAQSEQLRNKHGAIYESLKSEVAKQIQENGAYSDVDEMKLSQYIEGTAKMFADQVLGEANNRGVVIDDVLKSSEIVYKDGRLYLQGATQETKLKRLKEKKKREAKTPSMLQFIRLNGGIRDDGGELKNMDAGKQFIGLVNKNGVDVDEMGEKLWESGYFMQRPTPAEVLDFIDDELKGVKHYPLGYVEQQSVSQDENEAMLDSAISEYAEIMGYDLSKMSYNEKTEIYAQMQKNLFADETQEVEPEETEDFAFADNEFFQVADENARLDDIYPEYKGETITINGQEKTVYNSNGDRIAKSKEALENFYRWFGDSKVVDEQGRPLVVYHGTRTRFSNFDKTKKGQASSVAKVGFWFSPSEQFGYNFAKDLWYGEEDALVMPVYLNLQNPKIYKSGEATEAEIKAKKEIYDEAKKKLSDFNKEYDRIAEEKGYYEAYTFRYSVDVDKLEKDFRYAKDELHAIQKTDAYEKFKQDVYRIDGQPVGNANVGGLGMALNDYSSPQKLAEKLKDEGYDGIIIENTEYDASNITNAKVNTQYVAFEPNQIKSTSNRGTYSESENIYYQEGDEYEIKVATGDRTAVEEQKSKNAEYNKLAKEYYGTTNKLSETGYILTDGSLLDFSGKKFGGSPNNRSIDHREIVDALDKAGMEEFINSGNIRYLPEGDKILLSNEPTPQQYKVIERIINNNGGYITIELMNDANKWGMNRNDYYGEYEDTTFNKVKRDIKAFYTGEGVREITTFFQSAFAGSRVDYDRPSLEAIGSGEGNQAHGWGLYYALDRDVAEGYRERSYSQHKWAGVQSLDQEFGELKVNGKPFLDVYNVDISRDLMETLLYKPYGFIEEELENRIKGWQNRLEDKNYPFKDYAKEKIEAYSKLKNDLYENGVSLIKQDQGQVHEVDIPENPYLLDEQKSFREQSDYVKEALQKAAEDLDKPDFKEKVFDSKEEAFDFYDSKIDEFEEKADGYQRFMPQEFKTEDGKYGVKYVDDYTVYEPIIGENTDITGEGIYSRIAHRLGSQRAASQYLEKYGIKGITYWGRQDGRCFVIFNPADVKVIQKFYQIKNMPKQKSKIKGAFDALTKSIEITSEADFSTYQHEFAHYWLDNIWNYAQNGKASPEYMKRFNEIKKWLGVKGDYPTRTQHEKFARAYEKYLYRGEYANPIIGDTFKEYEDFIREVYSSIAEIDTRAGVKYKPVPKLVYDFFNSMVSGTLPYYGGIDEPKEVVEKETKEVKEYVKEEQKVLAENTQNYALKPVQTDTETGYLTAYKKMTGEEVEAGVVNLEKEQEKAEKFVNENPDLAKQIVDGVAPVPDGMLKNTIYLAYDKLQKRLGNTQNRVNSLMNQALELRRMGQEISSQKLAYRDETSPLYWIQTVQDNKASALADSNKMTVKELNDLVNKSIKDGMKQGKTAKEIAKDLREQLGVTQFYQEEVYPTEETEQASYNYIYKYVNQQLGLGMTMEEAETITRKADDMLSSLENSKAPNGNPSVEYFVKQKDLENYANSIAPSSQARVLVSVVGRGNLLSSIKSPLTNVISNAFVGAYRSAVRRIMLGQYDSIVNPELIKQNKQYSWEIFRKTGYNVNNITPETPRNTILGEKLTHSEGEGKIRALGRFYENLIYKWSLGAGDVVFKDYAFTDYVALKATKESGGDVNKANEIFKDACLIEPQTELGQQIRDEAIQESLIATYQNKGLISDKALKARQAMDFGVGFGEFIAPFVKTPANVVSMGLKAGFGSVKAVASEIQRDIKAGKIQTPTKENVELVVQNGLGLLVASLLLGAIDDEDYMPPYALATNKDKQLAKELNIAYNSIRIGNTWVSLDYLGPLASPLVGLLQARREDGILNSIFGYSKSGMIQSLSIPAFGNIADIFTNIQNTVRKDGADVVADTLNDTIQAVYSRTIPSIVSDVAKMLDKYERETKGHEIKAKIPLVRESLPKKVSVTSGRAESLDSPIQELLFGARAKTQVVNPVARELQRLNNEGFGVSLTPVTQRGKLSEVDDKTKEKVRQDFAKEYSKQVGNLIKSASYKRMDNEDKQQAIDKIRRKTIESLKKRYLK